jgi:glycosyltransferase involved in cell wall biosynthesis
MGNSLALCMMVKNEQQYLPYCLASIHKFCNEIIVVDTGSTDKTVEIAEAFGAYVIHAPWKNDFALIRNIAQSPATSDWIIWLDGDEVLSDSGIKKIKQQLLNDNTADFFLCPRVNFWHSLKAAFCYPDSQYKIYRNNIGLKWRGKIHEKIYDDQNPYHRKRLKQTDVHTFHYAYVKSPEEIKKKMQLYIGIENPDMDPRQIEKCSTEHSFFFDKPVEGVQEYNGAVPEVFQRLVVTQEEIRWIDGPSIIKFKSRIPTAQFDHKVIDDIAKQTPPIDKLIKKNYSDEIKDMCSIVIATYNKIEYLAPCIRDIYSSTHIPFEIIVVDNGSSEQNVLDYLVNMEKEHNNFRFIHLEKNYGFAKGYNEGLKVAKGEWLCVLNNDTLPSDGCFDRLVNHLKQDEEIKIIGPVSNNIHGENQLVPAPEGSSFGDYLSIMDKVNKIVGSKRVHSSWIPAACWVFHKSLIEDLSKITNPPRNGYFFCEDFPFGMGEDSDVSFAVQHRLHMKLGIAKDVFLWHHGQKTLETVVDNWRELQHNNNLILRKRWPEIFPDKK